MGKKKQKREIPVLVYSRIVGYLTPVQNWHNAKKKEFEERKVFKIKEDGESA